MASILYWLLLTLAYGVVRCWKTFLALWLPVRYYYVPDGGFCFVFDFWSDAATGGEPRYRIPVQPTCQWFGLWPWHLTVHLATLSLVTLHQVVFHRSVSDCHHHWPAHFTKRPDLLYGLSHAAKELPQHNHHHHHLQQQQRNSSVFEPLL